MMPEYARYMKLLPFFIAANSIASAASAYGLVAGSNRFVLMAYAIFMATFSVKMFAQRLIRIGLREERDTALQAPLSVKLNACLVAATLGMMGSGFMRMDGEFDTPFFEVFGVILTGAGAACLLALRRGANG